MKHNRKRNIFGWLSASMLLLATACATNDSLDVAQADNKGTNIVTFTVQPQSQTGSMRSYVTGKSTISDGSQADILIFAVYDEEGNVLTDFQKSSTVEMPSDFTLGEGQNIIKVAEYPVKIQLATDPSKKYQVAFWAQNSTSHAYDVTDLKNVKVNYAEAKNNDELRDAFCISTGVFDGTAKSVNVTLRRPFAQINVGTTGWDYEGAAALEPYETLYTESKITLEGVAQYYDVLEGKADSENLITTTFDYGKLPAFLHKDDISSIDYKDITDDEVLTVKRTGETNKVYNDEDGYFGYVSLDEYNKFKSADGYFKDKSYTEDGKVVKPTTDEETEEEVEDDTAGTEETITTYTSKELFNKGYLPATEVFKYLSMCYALVPEAAEDHGTVLNSVKFSIKGVPVTNTGNSTLATTSDDGDDDVDGTVPPIVTGDPEDPNLVFELKNVPVQKNWRTNILGNNLFVFDKVYTLDIVPDYCGDFNDDIVINGDWPEDAETTKTYTLKFQQKTNSQPSYTESDEGFFSCAGTGTFNKYGTGIYNGASYTYGWKMDSQGRICFTTEYPATVRIVQSTKMNNGDCLNTLQIDGSLLPLDKTTTPDGSNIRLYSIDVSAGNHEIKRYSGESGIFCVEVEYPAFKSESPNDDFDGKHTEDGDEY